MSSLETLQYKYIGTWQDALCECMHVSNGLKSRLVFVAMFERRLLKYTFIPIVCLQNVNNIKMIEMFGAMCCVRQIAMVRPKLSKFQNK